jgi:hypothetical protein
LPTDSCHDGCQVTSLAARYKALEAAANAKGLTVILAVTAPMKDGDRRCLTLYGEHHPGDLAQQIEDAFAELAYEHEDES